MRTYEQYRRYRDSDDDSWLPDGNFYNEPRQSRGYKPNNGNSGYRERRDHDYSGEYISEYRGYDNPYQRPSQDWRAEERSYGDRYQEPGVSKQDRGWRDSDARDWDREGNRNSRNYGDNDGYYYDPSEYNRNGYRPNGPDDRYNKFAGGRHPRPEPQESYRRSEPQYNYYESYPSYGQGAPYNDHEYGYIDKQEARGMRGYDNEDSYGSGTGRHPEDTWGTSRRYYGKRNRY